MALTDYIAVRGSEPTGEEAFWGSASGGSVVTVDFAPTVELPHNPTQPAPDPTPTQPRPVTPIAKDDDLSEQIWQAQNARIQGEIDYCRQLDDEFKDKVGKIAGWQEVLLDIGAEIVAEGLSIAVGFLADKAVTATSLNPIAGKGVGIAAGIMSEVAFGWAIEYATGILTNGSELLEAIIEQDQKLLAVEKSRENYEYRETVLRRNREDIRLLLEQLRQAEKDMSMTDLITQTGTHDKLDQLAVQDNTVELGDAKWHIRSRVLNF